MRAPLLAIIAVAASAQSFDSASVAPNRIGTGRGDFLVGGGHLAITNFTLRSLIQWAYQVRDFQVTGGPSWLDFDKFDVTASARAYVEPARMRELLQGLLADRFGLAVHRETKAGKVYVLTVEKGAHRLPEVAVTGDPSGIRLHPSRIGVELVGHDTDTARLAAVLTGILRRQVLDQTGLHENIDFRIEWTPDPGPFYVSPSGPDDPLPIDAPFSVSATDPVHMNGWGPTIFQVLSRHLGLKLDSRKAPVEILSVDRVQRLRPANE